MLTIQKLTETALERSHRWKDPFESVPWSLSDWVVATVGEMGEACNIIKKLNRAKNKMKGNKEDVQQLQAHLAAELGDTMIYFVQMASIAGVDLEKAVISAFNRKSIELGFPERL